jgi:hypothetical protein
LQKIAVVWAKNASIFAKFFGENIFKIITSVPGGSQVLIEQLGLVVINEINLIIESCYNLRI